MKKKRPRIKYASFVISTNDYEKKIKEKLYHCTINSIFEKQNKNKNENI
jgi:hypothetical protein